MIDGQCKVIVVTLMTGAMDIMTLKLLAGINKVKEGMVSVRSGIIYAMQYIEGSRRSKIISPADELSLTNSSFILTLVNE